MDLSSQFLTATPKLDRPARRGLIAARNLSDDCAYEVHTGSNSPILPLCNGAFESLPHRSSDEEILSTILNMRTKYLPKFGLQDCAVGNGGR